MCDVWTIHQQTNISTILYFIGTEMYPSILSYKSWTRKLNTKTIAMFCLWFILMQTITSTCIIKQSDVCLNIQFKCWCKYNPIIEEKTLDFENPVVSENMMVKLTDRNVKKLFFFIIYFLFTTIKSIKVLYQKNKCSFNFKCNLNKYPQNKLYFQSSFKPLYSHRQDIRFPTC